MNDVKKFIEKQMVVADIDSQRQCIITQSSEIQNQTDRIFKFLFEGPDQDSTGQRVTEWTARQSRSR